MFKSLCSATGQATPCRFCGEGWKLTPCVEFRLQNSFECNSLADPDRWADRSMCLPDGVTYTLSICLLKLKACRQQHSQIMENRACTSSPLEEPQEIFRKDFFLKSVAQHWFWIDSIHLHLGSVQYIYGRGSNAGERS